MPTVNFKDIPNFVGVKEFLFGGIVQGNDIYGHYFQVQWDGFHCISKEGQEEYKGFEEFKALIKCLLEDSGVNEELQCVDRSKNTFNFKMPSVKKLKEYYKRYHLDPIGEFKSKKEAEDYIVDWLQDGLSPEYPVNPNSKKFRKYLWEEGYLVKFGGSFIVTLKGDYSNDILDGFETV